MKTNKMPLDISDDKKISVNEELRIFKYIDGEAQKAEVALFMQKEQIDRQRLNGYDLMKQVQLLKEKLRTEPKGGKADQSISLEELYGAGE
jgi:hypothetical protein